VFTICFQWHWPSSQVGSLKTICSPAPTQIDAGSSQSVGFVQLFAGAIVRCRQRPAPHGEPAGHAVRIVATLP
jgi:hypothetical protein